MTKKSAKKKSAKPNNYLVLSSSCGKPEQVEFRKSAKTLAAAQVAANKVIAEMDDGYGNTPKSVYVVKIEKVGKPSNELVWS